MSTKLKYLGLRTEDNHSSNYQLLVIQQSNENHATKSEISAQDSTKPLAIYIKLECPDPVTENNLAKIQYNLNNIRNISNQLETNVYRNWVFGFWGF